MPSFLATETIEQRRPAADIVSLDAGKPLLRRPAAEILHTKIRFSFELDDLQTDHQFPGQRNSFHVTYEYAGLLKGEPASTFHTVSNDTFPFFETVRNDLRNYVVSYKDKGDFYEIFGANAAAYLLTRYPQLKWIEITIRVPAFGPVTSDRTAVIHTSRE